MKSAIGGARRKVPMPEVVVQKREETSQVTPVGRMGPERHRAGGCIWSQAGNVGKERRKG